MTNTAFFRSDSVRFDASAVIPEYPVRRGLRGLWRAEDSLDLSRRNLAALVGSPKLADVTGSPTPSLSGVLYQGTANYLTTDVFEAEEMTVCAVVQATGDFSVAAGRPAFFGNYLQSDGALLYVATTGTTAGRARVRANSYNKPNDGSANTNSSADLVDVDVSTPTFIVARHSKTAITISAPTLGLSNTVARPSGVTRALGQRPMRLGSSYANGFAGAGKVITLGYYSTLLTDDEIALFRTTELAWQAKLGTGITF